MTQYNSVKIKLSNSQFDKLNSATTKNQNYRSNLKLSSNIIGNSNDETNFPHELLLTDGQVARLRKDSVNNSPTNKKSSKTQIYKMINSGRFLGDFAAGLLALDLEQE